MTDFRKHDGISGTYVCQTCGCYVLWRMIKQHAKAAHNDTVTDS